jgi:hypothetical protein
MAVTITNTKLVSMNTGLAMTANAATSTVIDTAEVFTATPTRPDYKLVYIIYNGSGHGAITYSIAVGDFWAGTSAVTGSVAAGASVAIELEGGRVKQDDGTVAITLTPASGKRLLTDHAAGMYVIETL